LTMKTIKTKENSISLKSEMTWDFLLVMNPESYKVRRSSASQELRFKIEGRLRKIPKEGDDKMEMKARCSKCGHWTTNINGLEWLAMPKGKYKPLCRKCQRLKFNPSKREH